jgi:hypothetical protein
VQLHYAIENTFADHQVAFPVLCCNTDAKNVEIDEEDAYGNGVTLVRVATCIEKYKHVQAYIDAVHHRILNLVLSEYVPVDSRFSLGQMGIYQEPLERALIPSHVLNAEVWFYKYQQEHGYL